MDRTPHSLHESPQRYCSACRWAALSAAEQQRRRVRARRRASDSWRRTHPDRAAIRDRLTAGATADACDRCGRARDLVAIIDYERETITAWRCRPCWRLARAEWQHARHAVDEPDVPDQDG